MLQHPIRLATGKTARWKGIVALSMAVAGTISFVIALLASAFVMTRKED
ncbi:MAG: hypothetical protein PHE47_02940 [Oscillospiraceae bacterium]|nr:hypothetical protein [Oscillospiraceae bacterium]